MTVLGSLHKNYTGAMQCSIRNGKDTEMTTIKTVVCILLLIIFFALAGCDKILTPQYARYMFPEILNNTDKEIDIFVISKFPQTNKLHVARYYTLPPSSSYGIWLNNDTSLGYTLGAASGVDGALYLLERGECSKKIKQMVTQESSEWSTRWFISKENFDSLLSQCNIKKHVTEEQLSQLWATARPKGEGAVCLSVDQTFDVTVISEASLSWYDPTPPNRFRYFCQDPEAAKSRIAFDVDESL